MDNRGADPRASQETQGAYTMRLREAQSGPVPCSGARRQNKVLDVVSAAILGGVAAENVLVTCRKGNENFDSGITVQNSPNLAKPKAARPFRSGALAGWACIAFSFLE